MSITESRDPAQEAQIVARAYAAQAWSALGFVAQSSVWRIRFTAEELAAAETIREALARELEATRDWRSA
jgi:hypothetical protein